MTNFEKECKENQKEIIKAASRYYSEYQPCEYCRIKSFCRELKNIDDYALCEYVWYKYFESEADE